MLTLSMCRTGEGVGRGVVPGGDHAQAGTTTAGESERSAAPGRARHDAHGHAPGGLAIPRRALAAGRHRPPEPHAHPE
jgi:hypothetical protein